MSGFHVGDEVDYKRDGHLGSYRVEILALKQRRAKIRLIRHNWYECNPVSQRPRWVSLGRLRWPLRRESYE